jgi:hypothetical protein
MSLNTSMRCAMRPMACVTTTRTSRFLQWTRHSSHSPLGSSSNPSTPSRKKVTLPTLMSLYRKNEPITVMTAHDFPSAHVADQAGMDMVLVGDSLAMVALGMDDTSQILMEEMLLHCRSVARGAKSAFIVRNPPKHTFVAWLAKLTLSTLSRSATCPWARTKSRPTKPSPLQSP